MFYNANSTATDASYNMIQMDLNNCKIGSKELEKQNIILQDEIKTQNQHINTQKQIIYSLDSTINKTGNALGDASAAAGNHPSFSVLIVAMVLLVCVPFITFLYNQILTHQIMLRIEKNGVLDALVKTFKTGIFAVDINGDEQTFRYFWDVILMDIDRLIIGGRFFLNVALFVFILGFVLLVYSMFYRGVNYQHAARITACVTAIILGFTFLFMNNQTMNKPFENVIGYGFISLFQSTTLRDCLQIFTHKYFEKRELFPGAHVYYDFLLNTLNINNFPTVLEEIYTNHSKYDFKINTDPQNGVTKERVNNLFQLILDKNTIGNMCWMYFASLVSVLLSMQYLLAEQL